MRGGYREGAGRKIGFSAISAEEARKYVSRRVAEEIGPLTEILIEKAKSGDIKALQVLFDRAWGRTRQEIQIIGTDEANKPSERILELARALNSTK